MKQYIYQNININDSEDEKRKYVEVKKSNAISFTVRLRRAAIAARQGPWFIRQRPNVFYTGWRSSDRTARRLMCVHYILGVTFRRVQNVLRINFVLKNKYNSTNAVLKQKYTYTILPISICTVYAHSGTDRTPTRCTRDNVVII